MRKYCFLLIMLFTAKLIYGQQYPWCQDSIPIILDMTSKYGGIDFDKISNDRRLVAIIHRFGEGTHIDTSYQKRKKMAKAKGLLWGGYHMFTNKSSMEYQVNRIVQYMDIADDDLVSLNFEDPGSGSSERPQFKISMDSVFKAIQFFYDKVHRYPVVYFGPCYIKDSIERALKKYPEAKRIKCIQLLANCPLWFVENRIILPKVLFSYIQIHYKIWENYTLWQFSEGKNCKPNATGTIRHCDCKISNPDVSKYCSKPPPIPACCLYPSSGIWFDGTNISVYNGTINDIRKKWPSL